MAILLRVLLLVSLSASLSLHAAGSSLSGAELDRIGKRIWKSECDGMIEGLTSWNAGEEFPSLGIGHFIWYPTGYQGPFEESFPKLLSWYRERGVALPEWLEHARGCPWPTRAAFLNDHDSARQKQLRALFANTTREQVLFIMRRLHDSTPQYREAAGRAWPRVERNLALMEASAAGNFALIDYINFKGTGLNPKERYKGEGWGLLQVLMEMDAPDAPSAPAAFGAAATHLLERRVANSPPERGEKRWMQGWRNRCAAYGGKF
jgi:hypothetical protein